MQLARKMTYLGLAVAASAALVAASFQATAPARADLDLVANSAQLSAPELSQFDEALDAVPFPAGTLVERSAVTGETAGSLLAPPSDVVVTPAQCSELLSSAVGDLRNLSGSLHRGTTTDNVRIDKLAVTASGGVNLSKLRETARDCNKATVTVRSLGLTGVLSFTEFEGPSVAGAESIGITQTLTMPGSSELERTVAAAGSSSQVYVANQTEIVAVCGGDIELINGMAESAFGAAASL